MPPVQDPATKFKRAAVFLLVLVSALLTAMMWSGLSLRDVFSMIR